MFWFDGWLSVMLSASSYAALPYISGQEILAIGVQLRSSISKSFMKASSGAGGTEATSMFSRT